MSMDLERDFSNGDIPLGRGVSPLFAVDCCWLLSLPKMKRDVDDVLRVDVDDVNAYDVLGLRAALTTAITAAALIN